VTLTAIAGAVLGLIVTLPAASTTPSGCTSIADIPPTYSGIQFGAAIEGIFTNFNGMGNGCTDCHTTNGGTNTPSGYLNLDPSETSPWTNLVNVESPMYPGLIYVVPNRPEQSLLFQKVNCDVPGGGGRMPDHGYPDGMTTLSPYQQALIYDWIAEGAPAGTTDGIFRNGFDVRGFAQ